MTCDPSTRGPILDLQLKAGSLETGCLDATVLIDSDDPAHVVIYETWESIEHDRAYRAWRAGV